MIVEPGTGNLRSANDLARQFLDIEPGVNVEALQFSRFCFRRTDYLRIIRRVFVLGLRTRVIAVLRTFTGRVFAVQLRGKYLDVIYPSYFIVFEAYRELPLLSEL